MSKKNARNAEGDIEDDLFDYEPDELGDDEAEHENGLEAATDDANKSGIKPEEKKQDEKPKRFLDKVCGNIETTLYVVDKKRAKSREKAEKVVVKRRRKKKNKKKRKNMYV
ncbi:hypothetical protein RFI_06605 [Reticulomyxa filosa]|uniref:Uncharacterized protein n=1 Tax=Reticulomyxa filosa TaxID=46433 RepID=X6NW38_RETFI|nr:hypothetical protein RFI_06605 [Reticulomyxa filosa]|eukprot:ETO30515.1 hypothetical protein RFI_06605 [Reticulomyxa filosa]